MSPAEVFAVLGEPEGISNRHASPRQNYLSQGLIVHYSRETQTCEAIDMVRVARPVYRGQQLMGESWQFIETWFRSLDENLEETDIGLRSRRVGLYLSHNQNEDDEDVVDGVFIFERGYWEKILGEVRGYNIYLDDELAGTTDEMEDWVNAVMAQTSE